MCQSARRHPVYRKVGGVELTRKPLFANCNIETIQVTEGRMLAALYETFSLLV